MNLFNQLVLGSLFLSGIVTSLEGAAPSSSSNSNMNATSRNQQEREEYNILRRDQIDNSNTLAIPFDDSEIEDEEEINRDEKKEVFPLPHSR